MATEKEEEEETKEFKQDNPMLGRMFFVIASLVLCSNFILFKIFFGRHPDLHIFEVTLYISVIAVTALTLFLNRRMKHVLYDSVLPGQGKWIALNVFQLTSLLMLTNICMMNFPLTLVATSFCCAPFLTVFLARIILGESMPWFRGV